MEWSGVPGKAIQPPQISRIQLPDHTSGSRVEAVADGAYQSVTGKLESPIDLKRFEAIEFSIRHNVSGGKVSFAIMLFCRTGMVLGRFSVPNCGWNLVRIPLDASSFEGQNGGSVVFSELNSIRISPFDALNAAGKFLEISTIRLIPCNENRASAPIKVMNYRYRTPPDSGEKDDTVLTDGDLTKNVHFRQYTENPDIIFDLGGRFAIDEIAVSSFAAPSHNYSELTISTSLDGKDWHAAGRIVNREEGIEPRQVTSRYLACERKMVGRYVRLQASRPRSDFAVDFSEVSFFGHTPDAAELAAAAEQNYDTGVPMPERNAANYFELKSGDWELWVSRQNGVINGAFYKGKLLVERFAPRYTLQIRARDIEISGYDDQVESLEADADSVTVVTANAKLPGAVIERTWKIDGNAVMEKVAVINRTQKERFFLRIATEVIFAQQFRKDGFYEMPGSAIASAMFRLPATEVQMDRALTNIPTLALENKIAGQTIWHTRYHFNDRFTYMDVGTEEDNLQIFRANGWLLTGATIVPADSPRQSFENRFSVTEGRLLKAFDEYLKLPEVAAFRKAVKRPAWLRDIRSLICVGWEGSYPASSKRLFQNYADAFSPRGVLLEPALGDLDGIWGDLLTGGEVRGEFGNRQTPAELQNKLRAIRATDSRFKCGYYSWFWSAFPWSTPVRNHSEWFVRKLRSGAEASWFPGVNVNYLRFWGIPESREEAVRQVINAVNFYEQDNWYLDGGKSGTYAKDWETMRIDDPLGQSDFYTAARNGIQNGHPERVICFNHCENPLGDLGLLESFGGTLTSEWRRGAVIMWKFKMYSYLDPWHYSVYIYWLPAVDRAFKNYLAGIGVLPSYMSRDFSLGDLPYIAARYEIRQSEITDAAVCPDWRFDWKENLEAMALHQGNNGWIYLQYHGEKSAEKTFSADTAPLGLTDSGKPLYAWLYSIKDSRKFQPQFTEPQIARAYRSTGWIAERAVRSRYLGKFPYTARFQQKAEFAPDEAKVLMLSQVPAVICSIESEPSHYLLAGQPGIVLQEENNALLVENEYSAAELGLILPEGELPDKITVNGNAADFKIAARNGLPLAIVAVKAGKSRIAMSTVKGELPNASALDVTHNGRTLSVTVVPENALAEVRHDGETLFSHTGSFTLELPETVSDGEYEVLAGTLSRKFALKGLSKPFKLRPILADLPDKAEKNPIRRTIRGIPVFSSATDFTEGAGVAEIDLEKLKLSAGSIRHYESHFNHASAALEIQAKRFLKLRLTNGFQRHNLYGYEPGRNAIRPNAQNFGGLMLDFGSDDGYAYRSAAGFGMQSEKRTGSRPEKWGKASRPDAIYLLLDALLDNEYAGGECWIDFETLGAPPGWNGKLWFTLHFENLSPDRTFAVEILETSDTLPEEAKAVRPQRLDAVPAEKVLTVLKVPGKPADWSKISALGTLTPFELNMAAVTTEVKAVSDAENLYLFWDCQEVPGRILNCEGGRRGKPWEADGTEFFVEMGGQPDTILHAVMDAEGHIYTEYAPLNAAPGKKVTELGTVPFTLQITPAAPGWRTEVTIPWSALGGRPKAGELRGFNMMRTHLDKGKYGFYTLAPGKRFYSGSQYRIQLEQ